MQIEETVGGTLETWSVDEVADAFAEGKVALIDVRTPQEYMFEHIEGALLLPLPFLKPEAMPSQNGKRLVLYCGSGARSEKAARQCLEAGYGTIAQLEGGFGAWKKAGRGYMGTNMGTGAPQRVEPKSG